MENILCLETATPVCSVVLMQGTSCIERRSEVRGAHAESMPGFIKEVLTEGGIEMADLNAVLLSAGPGSYTGLRIGAAMVKGMLFGHEIPLFVGNTLAGIALSAPVQAGDQRVHAVIDARRTHLYHQLFSVNEDGIRAAAEAGALPLEHIAAGLLPGESISGTGWLRLGETALEGISRSGTEAISAIGLWHLWNLFNNGKILGEIPLLQQADPAIFEPDYRGNPYP